MKIVSRGKVLNSPSFYRKKKIRRRIQLTLILVGLLLLISSFVYVTRLERFLIKDVEIVETEVINRDEIIHTVQDLLSGYYLWLIPRNNILVYPRSKIKNNLLELFPRLKAVNLKLDGVHKLNIHVDEREPFALYCADTANLDGCYFLDQEGFIFAEAPSFSMAVYFVYSTDPSIEDPAGKKLLSAEEFALLLNFIKNLSIFNIEPTALEIGDSEYSLFLTQGGKIIWRRDDDFILVYSNLEAFLSSENISAQEDFLDRILYLDFTIENKVHWKFKD